VKWLKALPGGIKKMKSNRPFTEIIAQHVLQYTRAFQAGQTIPPTVDEFRKSLEVEAKAFGIGFPDSIYASDVKAIDVAVSLYSMVYGQILNLSLPENPTPEYRAWYESTHR
jgi:hypothetical protein